MDGRGDDEVLLAKAQAAGPPSDEAWLLDPAALASANANANASANASAPQSWRDAAKAVVIKPRDAHPKIRDFERSVLPTVRTLRAQFVCDICPHCSRPVIRSVMADHVARCEPRRRAAAKRNGAPNGQSLNGSATAANGSAASSNGSAASNGHAAAAAAAGSGSTGSLDNGVKAEDEWSDSDVKTKKKRRAEVSASDGAPAPKKTKTTAKAPKAPKAKPAPKGKNARQAKQTKEKAQPVYNPDKNCGVLLPTGQPCMRSLTCKAHSMAQKRAVPGRTSSYDVMLNNYQRQHQARQQQQQQQQLSAADGGQSDSDQQLEAQAQQNPEREVQQVMEGLSRVYCPPLDRKVIVHSQARSRNFRLREMLALALLPRRLAPTGDALFGRSLAFRPEAPEALSPVRAPAVQQAIYLAQAQQLRQQQQQQLRQQQQQQQQQQQSQQQSQQQQQQPPRPASSSAAANSAQAPRPQQQGQQPPHPASRGAGNQ